MCKLQGWETKMTDGELWEGGDENQERRRWGTRRIRRRWGPRSLAESAWEASFSFSSLQNQVSELIIFVLSCLVSSVRCCFGQRIFVGLGFRKNLWSSGFPMQDLDLRIYLGLAVLLSCTNSSVNQCNQIIRRILKRPWITQFFCTCYPARHQD